MRRKPEAIDLARGSPALAWCLANCDQFRPLHGQPPLDWAHGHVGNKQTAILDWLGFPPTRSTIKLLRKLTPSCIDPSSMRTLRTTLNKDPHGTEMLRHQERINAGVHRLCCTRRLTESVRRRTCTSTKCFSPSGQPLHSCVNRTAPGGEANSRSPGISRRVPPPG